MAKVAYDFRLYAVDQTDSWNLEDTPLHGVPAFGVYIILEGEATHICSFEANSRGDFLENRFLYPLGDDDHDPAHEQAGDLAYENDGQWTSYFGFVDCARQGDYVSARTRIVIDSRDVEINADDYAASLEKALRWESPQSAHASARRDACRDAAWEAAREAFQGDYEAIPVTDDAAAYERHRRRQLLAQARADARYAAPNLFDRAGIELPLELQP